MPELKSTPSIAVYKNSSNIELELPAINILQDFSIQMDTFGKFEYGSNLITTNWVKTRGKETTLTTLEVATQMHPRPNRM